MPKDFGKAPTATVCWQKGAPHLQSGNQFCQCLCCNQRELMNTKLFFHPSNIIAAMLVFLSWKSAAQTNLYVAQDGSQRFKTVQSAIMSVPSGSRENPVIIHIAPGTYKEL